MIITEEVLDNLLHLMRYSERLSLEAISDLASKILASHSALGYEFGPSVCKPEDRCFAISASGNCDLLSQLNSDNRFPIFEDGWEIIIGIPPKNWLLEFELNDSKGRKFVIDGKTLSYSACSVGGVVELNLNGGNLHEIPVELQSEVVRILLFGEIGEQNFCRHVRLVWSSQNISSKPFPEFAKYFAETIPEAAWADVLIRKQDGLIPF